MVYFKNQQGISIVAAIVALVLFSLLGYTFTSFITVGSHASIAHHQSMQASLLVDAGMEYGIKKSVTDTPDPPSPECVGSPPPSPCGGVTRTLGKGSFTVFSDTNGLSAGQRRITSEGRVGKARRRAEAIITTQIMTDGAFNIISNWPTTAVDCSQGSPGQRHIDQDFTDAPPVFATNKPSLENWTEAVSGLNLETCREQTLATPVPPGTRLRLSVDLKKVWDADPANITAPTVHEFKVIFRQVAPTTNTAIPWQENTIYTTTTCDQTGNYPNPLPPPPPEQPAPQQRTDPGSFYCSKNWFSFPQASPLPSCTGSPPLPPACYETTFEVQKVQLYFRYDNGNNNLARTHTKIDNFSIAAPATALVNSWREIRN